MTDLIETAPRMELAIQDMEHLVEELRAYHAIYSPLLQRREQCEAAYTSEALSLWERVLARVRVPRVPQRFGPHGGSMSARRLPNAS